MTHPNEKCCLRCGETFPDSIFYDSVTSACFAVVRDKKGNFMIRAYGKDCQDVKILSASPPVLDADTNEPRSITLRYIRDGMGGPRSVTLWEDQRICPHCLEEGHITALPPDAGLYYTFLIGISGLPQSGKTVLCHSFFTGSCLKKLQQALHGCSIQTRVSPNLISPQVNQMGADPLGLLSTMYIVSSTGKILCVVYCKDSPGELFDPDKFGSDEWNQDFRPFEHCDALLFVADDRLIDAQGMNPGENAGRPFDFLRKLRRDVPTAVVLTKMDKLQQSLPIRLQDGQTILNQASPCFQATPSNAEAIEHRMTLDRSVILNLIPCISVSPLVHSSDLVGYFTLSAGKMISETQLDCSAGYNQHLPFLFLLNAMGLGNITGGEVHFG